MCVYAYMYKYTLDIDICRSCNDKITNDELISANIYKCLRLNCKPKMHHVYVQSAASVHLDMHSLLLAIHGRPQVRTAGAFSPSKRQRCKCRAAHASFRFLFLVSPVAQQWQCWRRRKMARLFLHRRRCCCVCVVCCVLLSSSSSPSPCPFLQVDREHASEWRRPRVLLQFCPFSHMAFLGCSQWSMFIGMACVPTKQIVGPVVVAVD